MTRRTPPAHRYAHRLRRQPPFTAHELLNPAGRHCDSGGAVPRPQGGAHGPQGGAECALRSETRGFLLKSAHLPLTSACNAACCSLMDDAARITYESSSADMPALGWGLSYHTKRGWADVALCFA